MKYHLSNLFINAMEVKDSWDKVTLKEFLLIKEIEQDLNYIDLEKDVKTLAILADKEDTYFDSFTVDEIIQITKPLKYLKTEPTGSIKDYYTLGDRKYKLTKELKDFQVNRYTDLVHYSKDPELIYDNMHLILSTMLVPVIEEEEFPSEQLKVKIRYKKEQLEKYGDTPMNEVAETIYEHMKITDCYAVSAFFLLLYGISQASIQHYLELTNKETLKSALKMLRENPKTAKLMMTEKQQEIIGSLLSTDGSLQ